MAHTSLLPLEDIGVSDQIGAGVSMSLRGRLIAKGGHVLPRFEDQGAHTFLHVIGIERLGLRKAKVKEGPGTLKTVIGVIRGRFFEFLGISVGELLQGFPGTRLKSFLADIMGGAGGDQHVIHIVTKFFRKYIIRQRGPRGR